MILITNDPELSTLFKNKELKRFMKNLLKNLEEPYVLKEFLTLGAKKFYKKQLKQLSLSFIPIVLDETDKLHHTFLEVERCIDGTRFKVGDLVIDLVDPEKRALPISRLYEDDRGLHIRLDVDNEGCITWRDLSRIKHKV